MNTILKTISYWLFNFIVDIKICNEILGLQIKRIIINILILIKIILIILTFLVQQIYDENILKIKKYWNSLEVFK